MKIYAASRASISARGAMWRSLRSQGAEIISSWIDEDGEGQTLDLGELWGRIMREIPQCDRLVLYVEPDDFPLKGALVEVGAAMALNKPIWVVCKNLRLDWKGRPLGSWIHHPLVTAISSDPEALRTVVGL